jgi:hypothetical protein
MAFESKANVRNPTLGRRLLRMSANAPIRSTSRLLKKALVADGRP